MERVIFVEKRVEEEWVAADEWTRSPKGVLYWTFQVGWAFHFGVYNWRMAELSLFGAPIPYFRGDSIPARIDPRGIPEDISPQVRETVDSQLPDENYRPTWFTLREAREVLIRHELGIDDELDLAELESALAMKELDEGISESSARMFRVLDTVASFHPEHDPVDLRLVAWYRKVMR